MPSSRNNRKVPKKKQPAAKPWTVAPSKPSAISLTKKKNKPAVVAAKKAKSAPKSLGLAKPGSKSRAPKSNPPQETLKLLKRYYPDAHCALNFTTPFELLVATILSAQCTDERVNMVTPPLFAKYPTPERMAKAPVADLENLIRSAGFYKNKAKSLLACSQALVANFGGQVPRTSEELETLAGVGRKTANVVLCNAYQIPSGIAVDTHVTRLTNRFNWVQTEDAAKIEKVLLAMFPQDEWIQLSHTLISHGRAICKARKPQCENCFLESICAKRLEY